MNGDWPLLSKLLLGLVDLADKVDKTFAGLGHALLGPVGELELPDGPAQHKRGMDKKEIFCDFGGCNWRSDPMFTWEDPRQLTYKCQIGLQTETISKMSKYLWFCRDYRSGICNPGSSRFKSNTKTKACDDFDQTERVAAWSERMDGTACVDGTVLE